MAHEKLFGICENKCMVEVESKEQTKLRYGFTYIVDSNQSLLDWANNVSGNDYSSVLIKKGEWQSNKGVNLSSSHTIAVVGETHSNLIFHDTKGLYYNKQVNPEIFYMKEVCVNVYTSENTNAYAFMNCVNLINCTGNGNNYNNNTNSIICNAYAFMNCVNLINCNGFSSNHTYSNAYAFMNCVNLINCKGNSNNDNGESSAFRDCQYLTNCNGFGNTHKIGNMAYAHGFLKCQYLTNCNGFGVDRGFTECDYLTNCKGESNSKGIEKTITSIGFSSCYNLTNCNGFGKSDSAGYGFAFCYGVSKCKASGNCTTSVFSNCYASQSENSAYVVADTANGGFNDLTNPST